MEKYMKEKQFTSELGIDWTYNPIATRKGNTVTRGVRVEMDKEIFHRVMNMSAGVRLT